MITINILLLQNYKLTVETFAARLAQSNLVTKTDFNNQLINLNKKVTQTNQNMCFFKMNLKSYRHFIQSIFVVKVNFKMMMLKII